MEAGADPTPCVHATTPVTLPATAWQGVGQGAQARVDCWLVAEGAQVEAGQPLVRVVLADSTPEVDAVVGGRLESILVPAGATFPRGRALARIATE